ncbi:hypothetical protein B0H34DRAFT_707737 [Crassisporium funariophilum]|nr:hypothetical protein B0H34DRAFT_707737 [Crassisporium funariophilum]
MSPISQETSMRTDRLVDDSIIDPTTAPTVLPPSHQAPATKVDDMPQQASTQPGDGGHVHTHGHTDTSRASNNPTQHTEKVPFKEQVIGYAQKTRGTLLGKDDLKEHGEMILDGQTTHEQDRA